MNTSRDKGFANGDAVIDHDGDVKYIGVVSEVCDDVVEVEYFDRQTGKMDTIEFHEDFVESVI